MTLLHRWWQQWRGADGRAGGVTDEEIFSLEPALTAQGLEYESLTRNLPASITLRSPLGKLTYCSPYTEVLTGYSLAEIFAYEGDFFQSLVHEDDRERYTHALRYGSEGERFNYRYRIVHRSGIEIWVETRTHPLFDDLGNLSGLLSITLDVDLTVRYQRQVERKNEELQEVTYMVSHDLKSPVVTLKGMVDILQQDFADKLGSDGQEIVSHLHHATLRLEQLVHSVLAYAKMSSEDAREEQVPLADLVAEVVTELKPRLEGVELVTPTNLPCVVGDRLMLVRILTNLLTNAGKYQESSRALRVTIAWRELRGGRYIELSIADNGRGIPASKLPHIFRPFQRAHMTTADGKPIEGSGIGLASVKKLTEKLGGEVRIESTEGQGTTVVLVLRHATEG